MYVCDRVAPIVATNENSVKLRHCTVQLHVLKEHQEITQPSPVTLQVLIWIQDTSLNQSDGQLPKRC